MFHREVFLTESNDKQPVAGSAPIHCRPVASAGWTSYRCRSRFGWIMIGANDDEEAWREALRSSPAPDPDTLQVWDGVRYVDTRLTPKHSERQAMNQSERYQDPPVFCPYCGAGMEPFMGPEDGPATSWAHPKAPDCKWSEHENLSNRRVAAARAAARRKHAPG